jgi:hypothetical protein
MESEKYGQPEELLRAARTICDESRRSGIILSGRIVDGRVELDQASQDEIAERFRGADRAFVAVNAPFDPKSSDI